MSAQQQIEARAADWLLKRTEAGWSESKQEELDRWLASSTAHQAAYWRLEHGWSRVGADVAIDQDLDWDNDWDRQTRKKIRWFPIAIAASLVAAFGAAQYSALSPFGSEVAIAKQEIETGRGERKIAALADGSEIELNTATRIRAAIGGSSREVWLDEGEAYFSIARHDGQRFIVHAGNRSITVLGTKFNVRRDGSRLILSVVEGKVSLADTNSGSSGRAVVVTGGDTAVADGASTVVTAGLEDKVGEALSWRDGMLSFDQSSLAEAAAEFNRYNEKSIVITDAAAGDIRIGGTFKWNNVDAFARIMRDAYGLHVEDDGSVIKISSR